MGGFASANGKIVELLRQRSRPYLFSNSLAPFIVGASCKVIDMLFQTNFFRDKLESNTMHFRKGLERLGFDILPGEHPIIPVMLYEADLSQRFADRLLDEGVYVIGFFYPVVPQGKARIRVQVSAAHEPHHIQRALNAFAKVGRELGVI